MVDPPTKPFRRPKHSRAAPDDTDADAVTVTTALGTATVAVARNQEPATDRTARPAPITITPVRPPLPPPAPRVRRLPGPSETGRMPSPKPRDLDGEPDTVTVAATSTATPAPAVPEAPAAPAAVPSAPVEPAALAPAPRPFEPAGLHPLTREQRIKGGTRRLVAQVPAPYTVVGDDQDVPALLTRIYAMVVRDHHGGGEGDTTHVVQLTPWYSCDLGLELVGAGRILGHAPVHGDVTPELPVDPPEPDDPASAPPGAPTPTVLSLRHPSVDDAARAALADAARVVVAADTSRSDRRRVQESVAALRELDLVVAGLVVYRGRIPRDPAYARW